MVSILDKIWTASGFDIPSIKLLRSREKWYMIMSDNTSIVTAISKSRTVYAVSKSMLNIYQTEENVDYYELKDPKYLKVISCTDNTTVKPIQIFVQDNLLKHI
jgi:hypothetical protein